jgi:hypothetical protein
MSDERKVSDEKAAALAGTALILGALYVFLGANWYYRGHLVMVLLRTFGRYKLVVLLSRLPKVGVQFGYAIAEPQSADERRFWSTT